jgi:hypothetical protein
METDLIEAVSISNIGVSEIIGSEHMGKVTVSSNRSENLLEVRAIMEPLAAEDRCR